MKFFHNNDEQKIENPKRQQQKRKENKSFLFAVMICSYQPDRSRSISDGGERKVLRISEEIA